MSKDYGVSMSRIASFCTNTPLQLSLLLVIAGFLFARN